MSIATDLVASIYGAFNAGDVNRVLATFDPDIEWRTPASLPWSSGTYRSPDGVARYFAGFAGDLSAATIEPESIEGTADVVVARGFERATVRATGQPFTARFIHVWRITGDRVTAMEGVADTAAVLAAFGPEVGSAVG